jgi:hypothetical protein
LSSENKNILLWYIEKMLNQKIKNFNSLKWVQ